VFSVCANRSTIEGYATAFRKIVADLFGLATDPANFDYQSGGRDEWLAKIHGIRLSEITPAKIREWKQSFPAAAGDDPLALRKARISVNTFLRRSRSLFSRKVLRQLPLRLPSPLPFDGVEFEPRQSMKYRSNFNVLDLIKLANKELRPSDPPVYFRSSFDRLLARIPELDQGAPSVSFQSLKSVVHIIDYDNVIGNGRLFCLSRIAFSMKLATAPVNWNNADASDFREWFPYPKILDLMVAAGYSATEWGMNMPSQVNPMLTDLGERQLRLLGGFVGLELRNEAKFTTEIERAIELGRFLKLLGGQVLIAADSGDQRRLAQSGRVDPSCQLKSHEWRNLTSALTKLESSFA
jgi:hypothetical protein